MNRETSQQIPREFRKIIRTCSENLYSNKLLNLKEIDEFLDTSD